MNTGTKIRTRLIEIAAEIALSFAILGTTYILYATIKAFIEIELR